MESLQLLLRDLKEAVARTACDGMLDHLIFKLLELHASGLVKTSHAVMEVLIAAYLLSKGCYHVDVERDVGGVVCDVYAVGPRGTIAVEVETGFTPPSKALYPLTYHSSRIVLKVLKLWQRVDEVAVAVPPHYLAPIPPLLTKRGRSLREQEALRLLLEMHCGCSDIDESSLKDAVLSKVLIVDVERGTVVEVSARDYAEQARALLCKLGRLACTSTAAYPVYYHSTPSIHLREALKLLCMYPQS